MAKKHQQFFEDDPQEWEEDDSEKDFEEDVLEDEDMDGEEDLAEDSGEMEEIEAKLENGEDFSTFSAEASSPMLKNRVIYSCPRCHRIYFKNKWIKDTVTDIYTVRTEAAYCTKCMDKGPDTFVGSIEVYDKKLHERKDAIIESARNVQSELENRQPFEIIIHTAIKNDILYIFTNTTRLTIEIARAIRNEWHGAIQYEWFERNQFLRAKWYSEIQNRDYFKNRIRASKEKRFGLFSFEDEN